MEDTKYTITTAQRAIASILFLLLGTIIFIMVHPIYKAIIGMSTNTYLNAIMFISFWTIAYFVIYKGTIWTLKGEL